MGWLRSPSQSIPPPSWIGDAGEVAAFAQTWANIQQQLHASGDELVRVLGDIDQQAGEAMDAYRRFQTDAAQHLQGAAGWAGAMSTGLQVASTIVSLVHGVVRDVISQLVGSAISWVAQTVFTLGLATPWVISQVTARVASWTAKVGDFVTRLLQSMKKLTELLDELKALMSRSGDVFASVLRGGPGARAEDRTSGGVGDAASVGGP